MGEGELRERVEAWVADDPDPGDRAELRALADRAFGGPDAAARAELRDRFAGRLEFGTAGLRGVVAAGPNRMNRAVVRAATAAVAGWLLGSGPDGAAAAGRRGVSVVVGCDARHRSAEFAAEAAGVLAGAGIAVHVLPLPCPTPLLAFAVRHLAASAGRDDHREPQPGRGQRVQAVPERRRPGHPARRRADRGRIAGLGPLAQIPVADAGSPLITRHGDEIARAYLDAVVATSGGPGCGSARAELTVVYTAMHGVAGGLMLRAIGQAGFAPPHVVAAQAQPDPDFPTVAFPNPEEPGALDLALADARRFGADLLIASDPDGDRLAVAVPRPGGRRRAGGMAGADRGSGGRPARSQPAGADGGPGRAAGPAGGDHDRLLDAAVQDRGGGRGPVRRDADRVQVDLQGGRRLPGARFLFGYEEALGYDGR